MKRISAVILATFIAAQLSPLALRAEEVKIGYIDTVKIFAEYKETVEAEAMYKKEVDAWKKKQSDLETELAKLREEIQTFVAGQPEVAEVLNVITLAWGDKVVIAVKARMAGAEAISGAQLVERINAVEARMQDRFTTAKWVFFEPDVR